MKPRHLLTYAIVLFVVGVVIYLQAWSS